jgi:hypothetical protein
MNKQIKYFLIAISAIFFLSSCDKNIENKNITPGLSFKINGESESYSINSFERDDDYCINNSEHQGYLAIGKSTNWGQRLTISVRGVFNINLLENNTDDIPVSGNHAGKYANYRLSDKEFKSIFKIGSKTFRTHPEYYSSFPVDLGVLITMRDENENYYYSLDSDQSNFEITGFGLLNKSDLTNENYYPDVQDGDKVYYIKVKFSCKMQLQGSIDKTIIITDGLATYIVIND